MRLPRKLKKKRKKEEVILDVKSLFEEHWLQQLRDFKPTVEQWNKAKWS